MISCFVGNEGVDVGVVSYSYLLMFFSSFFCSFSESIVKSPNEYPGETIDTKKRDRGGNDIGEMI